MSHSFNTAPAPLLVRARVGAAVSVALLIANDGPKDLPVLHATLAAHLGHQRRRDELAARSGLRLDQLRDLMATLTEALTAERRAASGLLELQLDGAIAHLRLSRLCRHVAAERFVPRADIWPLLGTGPRAARLSGAAMALEVLLRQLVRSCHASEAALQGYLKQQLGIGQVDGLQMQQLERLLFDTLHAPRLHPALLQPEVLTLKPSALDTLQIYLSDLRRIRNSVAHVHETTLGEESLLLFACEAGKIERLVHRAVAAGLLPLQGRPQPLGLDALLSEDRPFDESPLATGVPPWPPITVEQAKSLQRLQATTAHQAAGGRMVENIQLASDGRSPLAFRLLPNPADGSLGGLRISESCVSTPQGSPLQDERQVLRTLNRYRTTALQPRLPTIDEVLWALAPYGTRADVNPFGLKALGLDDAHWVQAAGGRSALVRLPDGNTDPRGTGRVRLVIGTDWRRNSSAP